MLEFTCSQCGKTLRVGEETAGRRGKCPQCGNMVTVPQADSVIFEPTTPPPAPVASNPPQRSAVQPPPIRGQGRKHRRWLIALIVAALICIPFLPPFPLWLGIAFMSLCILVAVPGARTVSSRLLRLHSGQKWRNGTRLAGYSLVGLILILGGIGGASYKAGEEKAAADRAAAEAEQRQLEAEANQTVSDIAREAEQAWAQGDLVRAEQKLREAEAVKNATDMGPVSRLHVRLADAKVEALVAEAEKALEQGDLNAANLRVQEAIAIPRATATDKARTLESQIAAATDPARLQALLIALPDGEFSQLQTAGTMPAKLITGYDVLDKRSAALAKAKLPEVAARREQLRQNEIASKESAPAREILDGDVSVTVAVNILPEKRIIVHGKTNLPAKTSLMISIDNADESDSYGGAKCDVSEDGSYESPALGPIDGLGDGSYVARVTMPIPAAQPDEVRAVVGRAGESLAGPLVKRGRYGVTVQTGASFAIGDPNATPPPGTFGRLANAMTVTPEGIKYVRTMLDRLDSFKSSGDFHFYGFGRGGQYWSWLESIQAEMKKEPFKSSGGGTLVELMQLGLEYVKTKGEENNYTKYARKSILEATGGVE